MPCSRHRPVPSIRPPQTHPLSEYRYRPASQLPVAAEPPLLPVSIRCIRTTSIVATISHQTAVLPVKSLSPPHAGQLVVPLIVVVREDIISRVCSVCVCLWAIEQTRT